MSWGRRGEALAAPQNPASPEPPARHDSVEPVGGVRVVIEGEEAEDEEPRVA